MTQPNKTHFQMPGLHSSFLKTNNSSYTLCFTLDRQWHWNSSSDATQETFYFHSDECWTAFQSNTSLDFSVLLHCSGLTL